MKKLLNTRENDEKWQPLVNWFDNNNDDTKQWTRRKVGGSTINTQTTPWLAINTKQIYRQNEEKKWRWSKSRASTASQRSLQPMLDECINEYDFRLRSARICVGYVLPFTTNHIYFWIIRSLVLAHNTHIFVLNELFGPHGRDLSHTHCLLHIFVCNLNGGCSTRKLHVILSIIAHILYTRRVAREVSNELRNAVLTFACVNTRCDRIGCGFFYSARYTSPNWVRLRTIKTKLWTWSIWIQMDVVISFPILSYQRVHWRSKDTSIKGHQKIKRPLPCIKKYEQTRISILQVVQVVQWKAAESYKN